MSLVLLLAATAATATPSAPQADAGKKVRCVREQVIGSLVSTRRVCHTEEEWQRIRRDANDEVRRTIQPGTTNSSNG